MIGDGGDDDGVECLYSEWQTSLLQVGLGCRLEAKKSYDDRDEDDDA
jgi:hypothetical protein